jgi:hypothetical protein
MVELTSKPGQSGGAASPPTNSTAVAAGLGTATGANTIPPSQVQSVQGQTLSQTVLTTAPLNQVRSCTFRVTQLPKSLEISLGILRQEVARGYRPGPWRSRDRRACENANQVASRAGRL